MLPPPLRKNGEMILSRSVLSAYTMLDPVRTMRTSTPKKFQRNETSWGQDGRHEPYNICLSNSFQLPQAPQLYSHILGRRYGHHTLLQISIRSHSSLEVSQTQAEGKYDLYERHNAAILGTSFSQVSHEEQCIVFFRETATIRRILKKRVPQPKHIGTCFKYLNRTPARLEF